MPNIIQAAVTLKNATNAETTIPIVIIGHHVRMPIVKATINNPIAFNTVSILSSSLFILFFMFFKF